MTHEIAAPDSPDADSHLIARLRGGDLEALGALFDRYYIQVYRTAAGIARDRALAEDITQDAFLRLHQYAHRIDTTLPLMPWLYRVTVNLAYTAVTRRHKRRLSLDALDGWIDRLRAPHSQSPDLLAERGEVKRHVARAIDGLRAEQRAVVTLHYLNDLSVEAIADILDIPIGTVKSRLHYARLKLRGILADLRTAYQTDPEIGGYDDSGETFEPFPI
jgi:RNA polymerase sigma-70 factor, ECF subfamily